MAAAAATTHLLPPRRRLAGARAKEQLPPPPASGSEATGLRAARGTPGRGARGDEPAALGGGGETAAAATTHLPRPAPRHATPRRPSRRCLQIRASFRPAPSADISRERVFSSPPETRRTVAMVTRRGGAREGQAALSAGVVTSRRRGWCFPPLPLVASAAFPATFAAGGRARRRRCRCGGAGARACAPVAAAWWAMGRVPFSACRWGAASPSSASASAQGPLSVGAGWGEWSARAGRLGFPPPELRGDR